MRPNKPINPGAHRGVRRGKGRYYTSGLPTTRHPDEELVEAESPAVPATPPIARKYMGRASVGPQYDEQAGANPVEPTADPAVWADPLDDDDRDLAGITIDLRTTLRKDVPDSFYQRHSSRVPGRESAEQE